MVGRVVHDLVAGLGQRADGIGIFVYPIPHEKERGVHVVLVQNVDQHLGILVAPRGVERERDDLVVVLHAVDRQLSLRGGHAHDRGTVHHPENQRDDKHERRAGSNAPPLDAAELLFHGLHLPDFCIILCARSGGICLTARRFGRNIWKSIVFGRDGPDPRRGRRRPQRRTNPGGLRARHGMRKDWSM